MPNQSGTRDFSIFNLDVANKLFLGSFGTITQATSKATGVTLNTKRGQITTAADALANAAEVAFTVTNSECHAGDVVLVHRSSGGTGGVYAIMCDAVAEGSFNVIIGNQSAGSLSEALVLNFVII